MIHFKLHQPTFSMELNFFFKFLLQIYIFLADVNTEKDIQQHFGTFCSLVKIVINLFSLVCANFCETVDELILVVGYYSSGLSRMRYIRDARYVYETLCPVSDQSGEPFQQVFVTMLLIPGVLPLLLHLCFSTSLPPPCSTLSSCFFLFWWGGDSTLNLSSEMLLWCSGLCVWYLVTF